MTSSDSEAARKSAHDEAQSDQAVASDQQSEADRASEDLRGQIAALRQQVKDAQDTLRDHERRREEGRTFKR